MNHKSVRTFSQRTIFSPAFLGKLQIVKEHCLQLLFPRVCPVCGKILKLPKGWAALLSYGKANGSNPEPDILFPLKPSISSCRSILICPDCGPSLPIVDGPVCRKCSKPLVFENELYCATCQKAKRFFDRGKSLWIHDDSARKIVYDLKFQNKRDNADLIAFEMAVQLKPVIMQWNAEVLLPVPLHKKRLRERGFNQAQLIAERISFWLSKLFGIMLPVDSTYLLRTENTKPQRILDVSARSQNVKKAFGISDSQSNYKSVILVDDIFTSGATLNACAKKLKEAGTEKVFFLTATVV